MTDEKINEYYYDDVTRNRVSLDEVLKAFIRLSVNASKLLFKNAANYIFGDT